MLRWLKSKLYKYKASQLKEKENFEEAIHLLSKVITFYPDDIQAILERGDALCSVGEFESSLDDIAKAVEIRREKNIVLNDDLESLIFHNFGKISAYMLEEYEDAKGDCTRALSVNNNDWEVFFTRGFVYSALNDHINALNDFNSAIAIDSTQHEVFYHRGLAFVEIERYENAIEDFSSSFQLNPSNFLVLNHRGRAHHRIGKYSRAVDDFTNAIGISVDQSSDGQPGGCNIFYNRAKSQSRLGKSQEAIEDFTKAIDFDSSNSTCYRDRACEYIKIGLVKEAIEDYSSAIELDPSNFSLFAARGKLFFGMNDLSKAMDDFSCVLELGDEELSKILKSKDKETNDTVNNEFFTVLSCRGDCFMGQKDYEQAIENYSKAIQLNSSGHSNYLNRGNSYVYLKDYENAIKDYTRALVRKSGLLEAYVNRGRSNFEIGDFENAARDFTRAIRVDSSNCQVFYDRAKSYYNLKEFEKAVVDFTKVIESYPKHRKVYYDRGNVHFRMGNYEKAIEDYSRSVKLNPKDHLSFYQRGLSYKNMTGHPEKAIMDFGKALKIHPKFSDARSNRMNLYIEVGREKRADEDANMLMKTNTQDWMDATGWTELAPTNDRHQVFVVSDLHINSHRKVETGDKTSWENDASTGIGELCRLVKCVSSVGGNSLVLNGDIVDLRSFGTNAVPHCDFSDSKEYKKLSELQNLLSKNEIQTYYIRGDHDDRITTQEVQRIFGSSTVVCDALRIADVWIEHGHRFDAFNCPVPWNEDFSIGQFEDFPLGHFLSRLESNGTGPTLSDYGKSPVEYVLGGWTNKLMIPNLVREDDCARIAEELIHCVREKFFREGIDRTIQIHENEEVGIFECIDDFKSYFEMIHDSYPPEVLELYLSAPYNHNSLRKVLESVALMKRDIGVCVFGHSHSEGMYEMSYTSENELLSDEKKVYLNTGEWSNRVDSSGGVFGVISICNEQKRAVDVRLMRMEQHNPFGDVNEIGTYYPGGPSDQQPLDVQGEFIQPFKFVLSDINSSKKESWYPQCLIETMTKKDEELMTAPRLIDQYEDIDMLLRNDGLWRMEENLKGGMSINSKRLMMKLFEKRFKLK